MSTYGRLPTPGRRPEDAFVADRVRQDALHDVGDEMVGWTWADPARPDRLYPRTPAALERAARLHAG